MARKPTETKVAKESKSLKVYSTQCRLCWNVPNGYGLYNDRILNITAFLFINSIFLTLMLIANKKGQSQSMTVKPTGCKFDAHSRK